MQGLFLFFVCCRKCRAGHFIFSQRLCMQALKFCFLCVRATPHIIYIYIYVYKYIIHNTYICTYIKYDIYINTIILSCKSIKQYRHIDTTPSIQKTHTAKNNRVYDDFNYMHPISKLENWFLILILQMRKRKKKRKNQRKEI